MPHKVDKGAIGYRTAGLPCVYLSVTPCTIVSFGISKCLHIVLRMQVSLAFLRKHLKTREKQLGF